MNDTQTTGPARAAGQPADERATGTAGADAAPPPGGLAMAFEQRGEAGSPGFRERGRMRRRMRFLRRARELAYRDLGGLVFDLHRFGRRNDGLVLAKLETIGRIDGELRALEAALAERQPVTVLHEAGVAACPRCAAIHGSDDRFCPNCGLAMDLRAERPMAGLAATATPAPASAPEAPAAAPAPAPDTASASASEAPAAAPGPALSPVTTPAPAAPPMATAGPAGAARVMGDERNEEEPSVDRPSKEQPSEERPAEERPAGEQLTEIIRPAAKSG